MSLSLRRFSSHNIIWNIIQTQNLFLLPFNVQKGHFFIKICIYLEKKKKKKKKTLTVFTIYMDQDQDSLLVKRRNDNHSPGPVIRELVPSSHKRSELSNTILCIFSGWDQRIGEGIPIPDSLGEEATFINICIGNGSLKCHRVLIPTTPSFGDKVICWNTGFTFKSFI